MARKKIRTTRIVKGSAGIYKITAGGKEKMVIVPRKDGGKPTHVPPDGGRVNWLYGDDAAWRIT